mmetsp:Transcript_2150/g.3666  ORF Transcript_2150/g.3666 Transcript_2150/m.3666 type:complete len:216 (+) Transcript_2150:1241-1888(+)
MAEMGAEEARLGRMPPYSPERPRLAMNLLMMLGRWAMDLDSACMITFKVSMGCSDKLTITPAQAPANALLLVCDFWTPICAGTGMWAADVDSASVLPVAATVRRRPKSRNRFLPFLAGVSSKTNTLVGAGGWISLRLGPGNLNRACTSFTIPEILTAICRSSSTTNLSFPPPLGACAENRREVACVPESSGILRTLMPMALYIVQDVSDRDFTKI